MDDFLANKIIKDLTGGTMTTPEAWANLQEGREVISDEKYDEIIALITEQLIEAEMINEEEELDLEDVFKEDSDQQHDFGWDDIYLEDWEYGSYVSFDPDE